MNKQITGNILLLASQAILLVCGYGAHMVITRFLPPDKYGTWGVLITILIWFELALMLGFPKGTTTYLATCSGSDHENAIQWKSTIAQLFLGIVIGIVFFVLSFPLSKLLNDHELFLLFQICAIDIPIYGLFHLNLGVLNGKHRYYELFISSTIYSLGKFAFISWFVVAGYGLAGAAWGNILSSVVALLASQYFVGIPRPTTSSLFTYKQFFSFGIPSTIFILVFSLSYQLDILFLKRLTSDKNILGYYLAAFLLARVPYFIIEGTSKTMFSKLSEYFGKGDMEKAENCLWQHLYFTFIILSLVLTVVIGTARDIIVFLFPPNYAEATPILQILIIAHTLVAYMYFFSQVLLSVHKTKQVTIQVIFIMAAGFIVNYLSIRQWNEYGACFAVLTVFFIGTLLVFYQITKIFSCRFPLIDILRNLSTGLIIIVLSNYLNAEGRIEIFFKIVFISALYPVILFLMREPWTMKLVSKLKNLYLNWKTPTKQGRL